MSGPHHWPPSHRGISRPTAPLLATLCTGFPEETTTPTMFRQDLPPSVAQELDAHGLNGVPVLLSTTTELSLAGQPRRHWIVANREGLFVVGVEGRDGPG